MREPTLTVVVQFGAGGGPRTRVEFFVVWLKFVEITGGSGRLIFGSINLT